LFVLQLHQRSSSLAASVHRAAVHASYAWLQQDPNNGDMLSGPSSPAAYECIMHAHTRHTNPILMKGTSSQHSLHCPCAPLDCSCCSRPQGPIKECRGEGHASARHVPQQHYHITPECQTSACAPLLCSSTQLHTAGARSDVATTWYLQHALPMPGQPAVHPDPSLACTTGDRGDISGAHCCCMHAPPTCVQQRSHRDL
jgi:hypothetical protein